METETLHPLSMGITQEATRLAVVDHVGRQPSHLVSAAPAWVSKKKSKRRAYAHAEDMGSGSKETPLSIPEDGDYDYRGSRPSHGPPRLPRGCLPPCLPTATSTCSLSTSHRRGLVPAVTQTPDTTMVPRLAYTPLSPSVSNSLFVSCFIQQTNKAESAGSGNLQG